jgi:hypothetical protein
MRSFSASYRVATTSHRWDIEDYLKVLNFIATPGHYEIVIE